MKKLATLMLAFMLAMTLMLPMRASATEIETINLVPLEKEVTESSFFYEEENLPMIGETYTTGAFVFKRFNDFVTVARTDNPYDDQILSGEHFVVTTDQIWFVNNQRQITCFDYVDFVYEDKDVYESKESWKTFGYADFNKGTVFDQPDFYEFDFVSEENSDDPIIFVNDNNTVVFWQNMILTFKDHDRTDIVAFPFYWKELSYYGLSYDFSTVYYAFVSSTNTVGLMSIKENGEISYEIYAEGNDVDRALFQKTEENHVSAIYEDEGYLIYYEDDALIGSNGKIHFSFDDMEYEEMWIGDSYGVGKGFDYCAILTQLPYETYANGTFDLPSALEETGINTVR